MVVVVVVVVIVVVAVVVVVVEMVVSQKCAFALPGTNELQKTLTANAEFDVVRATKPSEASQDAVMTIQGPSVERMEIRDKATGKTRAVVRQEKDKYVIFSATEPYPKAQKKPENETVNGELMYLYGELSRGDLKIYTSETSCKPVFRIMSPGMGKKASKAFYQLDGNTVIDRENVAATVKWNDKKHIIEVAPGADAALAVIAVAMSDKLKKDQDYEDAEDIGIGQVLLATAA